MQKNIYNADIYLRLSKEDGDKEESDSISNQRTMILNFLKTRPDIKLHKIRVDDGYSGVDFNRPAFIEMLDDIKEGIVDCVIVKDFSRFGRNYIENGKYIQVMFPKAGIRFIAINDGYDSSTVESFTSNIVVPFKNLLNDAYCADISSKVRSNLDAKRKRGDFVGAFAVYGYMKDESNKNKLVVDPFAAAVVCEIYKWKVEGLSAQGIADRLNAAGILSPMEYKKSLGLRYSTTFKVSTTTKWQPVAVTRILTNAIYTGVLEQGKRKKPNYKVRKLTEVPKQQWICTENAHDPIIERGTFETVQGLLKSDTRATKQSEAVSPLSGIIVCGDCGSPMVRKTNTSNGTQYAYYVCSGHRADKSKCSTHIIPLSKCEDEVLNALKSHVSSVMDIEKAAEYAEGMAYRQNGIDKLMARLGAKRDELDKMNSYRLSLYESYREGIIKKDDFVNFKASYDAKITDAERVILDMESELEQMACEENDTHNWIEKFRAFNGGEVLERKMAAELIERVAVYEGKRVEVVFRHFNEFKQLENVALRKEAA